MTTTSAKKKNRKTFITIVAAIALFITSVVFKDNPILKTGINELINTASQALTAKPVVTDSSTYIY